MTALAFVLAFDSQEEAEWVGYSEAVKTSYTSEFTLGAAYIPHATVVQFRGHRADAETIWNDAVGEGLTAALHVTAAGLCFLPAPDNSETWIEVPLLKNQGLATLQKNLLGLEALKGCEILNGCGDAFRPHITLGYATNGINLDVKSLAIPGPLLRRNINARVVLADTGPHYSVPRILYG